MVGIAGHGALAYVGQIERGIGNPSLQVMVKLATTLQMGVADLLKRERDVPLDLDMRRKRRDRGT